MATPNVEILDTGKVFLSQLLIEGKKSQVGQARIGSTSGFALTTNSTSPLPSTIATISADDIDVNIVNQNEARFSINFTEVMGNYDIGNIMLDLELNGVMVPFAWYCGDDPITKTAATSDDVGNSFVISFTIAWLNIDDLISIVVETPSFSSLPAYATEKVIPLPDQSLYQQFTVQQFTPLRTPALVMRRSADNKYFGIPFMQRLDDPYFGRMKGGFSGDRYLPYSGYYVWGGLCITVDTDYDRVVGGASLTETSFDQKIVADPLTYLEPA